MGIIKGFTFDGVNSLDYNIGITGSAVYNAPTRDVEMISIPGRDGAYALDHGRFNNIEITYPSGMGDNDQTNFAQRVSDLRNQLASRVGYKRLEDEYNPDEYRMAIYKSGLEVSPVQYSRAGQFDIIFDCKPQRFLKSGESAVSKANNSTITNPTLFDAHPLLQFRSNGSDGTINLGEQEINVLNSYIGVTDLILSTNYERNGNNYDYRDTITIENTSVYKSGDRITLGGADAKFTFQISSPAYESYSMSYDNANGFVVKSFSKDVAFQTIELQGTECTFTAGTQGTVTKSIDLIVSNGSTQVGTGSVTLALNYNGASTVTALWNVVRTQYYNKRFYNNYSSYFGNVDSTKSTLENVDIYIDLDIGEAYSIDSSNNIVSLNNFVNLGGELPKLAPEITTITYTNITNFKITPRWWKI